MVFFIENNVINVELHAIDTRLGFTLDKTGTFVVTLSIKIFTLQIILFNGGYR